MPMAGNTDASKQVLRDFLNKGKAPVSALNANLGQSLFDPVNMVRTKQIRGMKSLIAHSQRNLDEGKALLRPDGSISTIFSSVVEAEFLNKGKPTVIPTIWDGQQLQGDELFARIREASRSGVQYPSANTVDDAVSISKLAHRLVSNQRPQQKVGRTTP